MKNNAKIYMDNAATTAVSRDVFESMLPYYQTSFGNPSSVHCFGMQARKAIEDARIRIADALNCAPVELYFTSGATEANNLAVMGTILHAEKKKVVVSCIEHPSILSCCKFLERFGYKVSYIGVDSAGVIDLDAFRREIDANTAIACVMMANNETGVIQPIEEISDISHYYDVPLLADAVQAIGNIPIALNQNKIDFLSITGHKIKAPKGIGVLYAKKGTALRPIIYGGGQERGIRSGTENVPAIVGLSTAVASSVSNISVKRLVLDMKKSILNCINSIPFSYVCGNMSYTLPGIINVCFDYINGSDLVRYLDSFGICVSSASACSSNSSQPSHVLLSMGIPYDRARGALRISINEDNTTDEINCITRILPKAISDLRMMDPEYRRIAGAC